MVAQLDDQQVTTRTPAVSRCGRSEPRRSPPTSAITRGEHAEHQVLASLIRRHASDHWMAGARQLHFDVADV
jgi:hypothetical protein